MTTIAKTFPLAATLEALIRWQLDPRLPADEVEAAFAALVLATGARGAILEIDAPPLRRLRIALGTLSDMASTDADELPGVRHSPLWQADGSRALGGLWLDADPKHAELATPVIELAVDSVWARAELQANTDRLRALDDASRAIAGVLDVERVLQVIVDRVRDLVRAEYAALGTIDELGQITRFITSGMSDEMRLRIGPIPRGRGLLGLIIRENRSYRIREIGEHPHSSGFPPEHPAMHSFLGMPIVVKGRSVGNLYLTNKLDAAEFSAQDQHLVEMFALHAGIAYENAALHEQVQRLAIVDERQRIGKDLHDGIIQSIYGVGLSLEDVPEIMAAEPDEAAARIDRAIDALNGTIRDIRNFIFGLRPELVAQGGLVAGLATLASEFRLNTLIDAELESSGLGGGEPSATIRAELLQIAREALSNVARHAHASTVRLRIASNDGALELVVSDNGRGFDASRQPPAGHLGIANMRARAAEMGGRLLIESAPGRGTDLVVRVPVDVVPAATDPAVRPD